jgi:Protein of unknown function (DUF3500)
MRRSLLFLFAIFLVRTGLLSLAVSIPLALAQSADEMAGAAAGFLSALTQAQHAEATFAFTDNQRQRWHFIPPEMYPRGGITLKALDESQRELARALLMTGLSQRGFMTYSDIVTLERILNALGQEQFARDPEEHYLAVFGNPEAGGTWSFRFEGHHISLHFTVVAGNITVSTPTFFGANPAVVQEGEHQGLRALGSQEDAGRALMSALSAPQQQQALISEAAPRDIVTSNTHPIDPLSPTGISAEVFNDAQLQLLLELISSYSSQMADEIAQLRWQKIAADGTESITFAWAGSLKAGMPHYYRVQSPSFLIEYDNTQNNANHIHAVWRDFADDFGRDLLREHYDDSPGH